MADMRISGPICVLILCFSLQPAVAETPVGWPDVSAVAAQPLAAAVRRMMAALDMAGEPLPPETIKELNTALELTDEAALTKRVQELLDAHCIAAVSINPESRVKVVTSKSPMQLMQHGWRTCLVKVHNEAAVTSPLRCSSPQARQMVKPSSGSPSPTTSITPAEARDRWLELASIDRQPMVASLSGLALEYRIVQFYSRDAGKREASLAFDVGQGTQDIGFRNEAAVLFDCQPASEVRLSIRDADGTPTTAGLIVKDSQGRIYPNPARRLAPDFFFHPQVYRADGDRLELAAGNYTVVATRGPEYLVTQQQLKIDVNDTNPTLAIKLQRWIDPTTHRWYSGDHHVHAAGCAHYEQPTEGVKPEDMMRQMLGEDLKVGCVLSWGPCWYYQKQFFEGRTSDLSRRDYLMRYDVEVSGFPSSHAGHLCLLRLSEDDYPETQSIDQWPSWTLPVLKWGQSQGGVVGYSHSGFGLALPDYLPDGSRVKIVVGDQFRARQGGRAADTLPDYAMPRFDGIGANEFIVTVAHDACDFISAVDTPAIWELNIWYHTLNCGFRTRISGETDFPCIYGERVGLGRIYVQLADGQPLNYETWVAGLKAGRSYCGDGFSHVLRFEVNGSELGWPGDHDTLSQVSLKNAQTVTVQADVAARLDDQPTELGNQIRSRRLDEKPYWHLERCRIGDTRQVPVELIVNGEVAARSEILADGSVQHLEWQVPIKQSSWVAVRILPSVHTNPIWVQVGEQPVRANLASAKWCRDAVDVCWNAKKPRIRASEQEAAEAAYQFARAAYDRIVMESAN